MHRFAAVFLILALAPTGRASADSDGPWSLELSMAGNYPVVSARTPGREAPLRLVVDTAAGGTVLDTALAQQLGLTAGESIEVRGASGASTTQRASQPLRLTLVEGLTIAVQPILTDMSRFGSADIAYDGILGNDVLRQFEVRFDVPAGDLVLALPGVGPSPVADLKCIDNQRPGDAGPRLAGFGLFDLTLGIAGEQPREAKVRAVLDTGAAATVLNHAAAAALGVAEGDPRLRPYEAGTKGFAADAIATELMDLASAQVADWRAGSATMRVSELPVFQVLDLHQQPAAILGIDLLRQVPVGLTAGVGRLCFGTTP